MDYKSTPDYKGWLAARQQHCAQVRNHNVSS